MIKNKKIIFVSIIIIFLSLTLYLLINYTKYKKNFTRIYIDTKTNVLKLAFSITKNKEIISSDYLNKEDTFIATGAGKIDEYIYTNSLDALNKNYMMGVKIFELDLNTTLDNKVVAVHDWNRWKKRTLYEGVLPPSFTDFKNYLIDNRYLPLEGKEIINWFKARPDTKLIIDKTNEPIFINDYFREISDRIIIRTYTKKSLDISLNNQINNILIEEKIIWRHGLKKEYFKFLNEKKIKPYGFSVSKKTFYRNYSFYKYVKKLGFKVYIYGVNHNVDPNNVVSNIIEIDGIKENIINKLAVDAKVLCDLHSYIDGIYTYEIYVDRESIKEFCN